MTQLTTETIRETEYTVTQDGKVTPMDRQGHPLVHRTYEAACEFAHELEDVNAACGHPERVIGIGQRVVSYEPWFSTTREA